VTTRRRTRRRAPMFTQKGIALIAVMLAMATILIMTNGFGTKTTTDAISAANTRDQMRAHYLARSSLNLTELVIRLQQRLDNIGGPLKGVQITDDKIVGLLMAGFGGGKDEVKDLLGPVGDVEGLGAEIGNFSVEITTEDDKFNVNCANARGTATDVLAQRIAALYFFPVYDPIFSDPDADGWKRDRDLQTAAILDYIDVDSARYGQPGAPEDYGYETLKDQYWPKNNQLDTIGEMRLIRGVDDRLWSLFGDRFTVYGTCKTNLSAVTDPAIIASIIFLAVAKEDAQSPVLQNPELLWSLAMVVVKARDLGFVFTSTDDFAALVKDPAGTLMMGLAQSQKAGGTTPSLPGLPPGVKGVKLDKVKLDQIASAGPRRTYRIKATGEVERNAKIFPPIRRTINAVWDTQVTPQNYRPYGEPNGPVPRGAYVFLREE
jgi:general secretion pathway protein K